MSRTIYVPIPGLPEQLTEAFRLPGYITADETLVKMYNGLVESMRKEAQGITMTTVQSLIIERVASLYIKIKHAESGQSDLSNTQLDNLQKYWLQLVAEFNKLLKENAERQRADVTETYNDIIMRSLDLIEDPSTNHIVAEFYSTEMAKVGN